MKKMKVIAIVGPTGGGKTELSLTLAEKLRGQIVAMDSMQVYRRMDIGTAKPTREERARVPHHMLDVAEPSESYSVAQYTQAAQTCLRHISDMGAPPFLVGGTGLYLKALTDGLELGNTTSDEKIRDRYRACLTEPDGKERLHQRLRSVDPATADKLHPNDVRRVIRALEVYDLTGIPFSRQAELRQPADSAFEFLVLGVGWERAALYERVNRRVERMLSLGLMEEVKQLLLSGVPPQAQAMQAIGYKELVPVLTDQIPLEKAIEEMQRNTRRYAKRQWTWFRADQRVRWLDMADSHLLEQALEACERFLSCKEEP